MYQNLSKIELRSSSRIEILKKESNVERLSSSISLIYHQTSSTHRVKDEMLMQRALSSYHDILPSSNRNFKPTRIKKIYSPGSLLSLYV